MLLSYIRSYQCDWCTFSCTLFLNKTFTFFKKNEYPNEGPVFFFHFLFPRSQPRELLWKLSEGGAGLGVLANDEKETAPRPGPFLGAKHCAELLQAQSHGRFGCTHTHTSLEAALRLQGMRLSEVR